MLKEKDRIAQTIFLLCWLAIAAISYVYFYSSFTPWNSQKYNVLEPRVNVDTRYYSFRQEIYGNSRAGLGPNEYLIEKARNFYSNVGVNHNSNVHYRPDYDQYPVQTILILLFRLMTYVGLVLFLFLLSQITKSIYKSRFFEENNHDRIFQMGWLMVFIPIVRTVHSLTLAGFIRLNPSLLGFKVAPVYDYLWLTLMGVILLVFSFVFKEANRIHEEQRLTV